MKEYEIDLHNDPVLKEVGFMSCSEAGDQISHKLNDWTTWYNEINAKTQSDQVQEMSQ